LTDWTSGTSKPTRHALFVPKRQRTLCHLVSATTRHPILYCTSIEPLLPLYLPLYKICSLHPSFFERPTPSSVPLLPAIPLRLPPFLFLNVPTHYGCRRHRLRRRATRTQPFLVRAPAQIPIQSHTFSPRYLLKASEAKWEEGCISIEAGSGMGALARLVEQNPNLFHDLAPKDTDKDKTLLAARIYSYVQ